MIHQRKKKKFRRYADAANSSVNRRYLCAIEIQTPSAQYTRFFIVSPFQDTNAARCVDFISVSSVFNTRLLIAFYDRSLQDSPRHLFESAIFSALNSVATKACNETSKTLAHDSFNFLQSYAPNAVIPTDTSRSANQPFTRHKKNQRTQIFQFDNPIIHN